MLLGTKFDGDKVKATHIQRVDGFLEKAHEMRKEQRAGMWKGGTGRHVASIPDSAIEKWEETHPGFKELAFGKTTDFKLRDKAIREFLKSSEGNKFSWANV